MSYLVQGWQTFSFLLAPEELQKVLEPYHLVIFNTHVPIDYVESKLEEYIAGYRKLYEVLASGEKLVWEKHHPLLQHVGAVSDLSKCMYGRIHEYNGAKYKSADFLEPSVAMSPFALHFYNDSKERLSTSTSFSYIACAEEILGIQLQYPKKIQYPKGDNYEPLQSTEQLRTYQDYTNIKSTIMEITKPLRVQFGEERKSTGVRVSIAAKKDLARFYCFASKGITVI